MHLERCRRTARPVGRRDEASPARWEPKRLRLHLLSIAGRLANHSRTRRLHGISTTSGLRMMMPSWKALKSLAAQQLPGGQGVLDLDLDLDAKHLLDVVIGYPTGCGVTELLLLRHALPTSGHADPGL